MSSLGWSMPAGAWESTLPGEEDYYCDICGGIPGGDSCKCPECPVCGFAGNPDCVGNHMPAEDFGLHGIRIQRIKQLEGLLKVALDEAYQQEVLDTGMESSWIGPEKEYADKSDWLQSKWAEWDEIRLYKAKLEAVE